MAAGTARLLIHCPDARGIVAAVSAFIAAHDGNLLEADQHTDPEHGEFFLRVEVEQAGFGLTRETFEGAWSPVASRFGMRWRMYWGDDVKRMAIFVSREGHCLNDLLWRWKTGELLVDLRLVIGNHEDLRGDVEGLGIRFECVPVVTARRDADAARADRTARGPSDERASQNELFAWEEHIRSLLDAAGVDFIVLARYMQILSADFVGRYPGRIINIHHSFLPAFAGPRPYHQAYERGVKLIGATSHYVTEALDDGPIIAQETLSVGHRDTVADMVRKGRDLERVVLARAVRLHVEDNILVSKNRTVVFD